jgi:hypothetical protein
MCHMVLHQAKAPIHCLTHHPTHPCAVQGRPRDADARARLLLATGHLHGQVPLALLASCRGPRAWLREHLGQLAPGDVYGAVSGMRHQLDRELAEVGGGVAGCVGCVEGCGGVWRGAGGVWRGNRRGG